MITQRDIVIFIVGIAIGFIVRHAMVVVEQLLLDREERLAARFGAVLQEALSAQTKTHPSDSEKNTLAKDEEMPDNSRVKKPDAPADPPREHKRPFWDDPEQLKAARDRLSESVSATDEEALNGLLPHEAWRQIDERLLELEDTDPDVP